MPEIDIKAMQAKLAEMRRRERITGGAHPECPYCRAEQSSLSAKDAAGELEFWAGDDETNPDLHDCESCGRPFKVHVQFDVQWTSEMTDEEFEAEEVKRPDPNQVNMFKPFQEPTIA